MPYPSYLAFYLKEKKTLHCFCSLSSDCCCVSDCCRTKLKREPGPVQWVLLGRVHTGRSSTLVGKGHCQSSSSEYCIKNVCPNCKKKIRPIKHIVFVFFIMVKVFMSLKVKHIFSEPGDSGMYN